MRSSASIPRRGTRALSALAGLLLACTSSCKLVSKATSAPGQVASGLLGGPANPADRLPPNLVQAGVMRFADNFAVRITQAAQEFADKAGTPEARVQALSWTVGQNTSALTIASGPNTSVALLDMLVLVTIGRMVHEDYWMPKVWGEADRPMVEAFVHLENEIWEVAEMVLSQAQQDEVRSTLRGWREDNPDLKITAFVRLPAFRDIFQDRASGGGKMSTALREWLSVDPLSGLEPAVREIELTRLLAERSLFYLQRAPMILSIQVELLGLKLLRMPEVHSALEASERVSQAAASIAETAAKLPETARVEREAAVKQIADELSLQRQGIVADLEQSEAPVRKILTDARATLEAGTHMSAALQGAIGSLDAFVGRYDEEDPPSGAAAPPSGEPGEPFDVNDYGAAATQIGSAAREMNGLVTALDQSLPQMRRVLDEAAERSDRAIDHAFERGLQLGAILIAAAGLTTLFVRWISVRHLGTKTRQAVG